MTLSFGASFSACSVIAGPLAGVLRMPFNVRHLPFLGTLLWSPLFMIGYKFVKHWICCWVRGAAQRRHSHCGRHRRGHPVAVAQGRRKACSHTRSFPEIRAITVTKCVFPTSQGIACRPRVQARWGGGGSGWLGPAHSSQQDSRYLVLIGLLAWSTQLWVNFCSLWSGWRSLCTALCSTVSRDSGDVWGHAGSRLGCSILATLVGPDHSSHLARRVVVTRFCAEPPDPK